MHDDDAERPLNLRQGDHARADLDAIPEASNIQETDRDDIEARGVALKPLLPKNSINIGHSTSIRFDC